MDVIAVAEGRPRRYASLGARIAELRRRAGLTQRDFALAAGIASSYPPKIEAGIGRPDPTVLRRIAQALDADYDELAALAGYTTGRPGARPDVSLIPVSPEDAQDVARFARLSPQLRQYALKVIEEAERIGLRLWHTESVEPPSDGRPPAERRSEDG